jgi:HAD superfamily hydrolase (TIGR01509 family)
MKEIEEYIKDIVCFEDTENHKPHPDPLFLIAQKLDIKPEEAVYIGDAKTDLECARSAGMKFILFPESDITGADAMSSSFLELPDLIKKL